jgi:hypothetical protein
MRLINPDVTADDLNLALLQIAYPEFRFWHFTRGEHRLRWAAVRRNGADPGLYAAVTGDLNELGAALAGDQAQARPAQQAAAATRTAPCPDERLPGPMTDVPDRHPALTGGYDPVPALTLVLPRHLDTDQAARHMVAALEQARASLTRRALHYQQHARHSAIAGDHLGQAGNRGQALACEHAVGTLDEAVIEIFGLWEQYERQLQPRPPRYRPSGRRDAQAIAGRLRATAARARGRR